MVTPKSVLNSWRAFSTAFETYGAAVTPCSDPPTNFISMNYEGLPSTRLARIYCDDGDEKTGSYGRVPTFHQIVAWGREFGQERRLRPTDIAMIASMLLCNGATSDLTGAYKHRMIMRETQLDLRTRTMLEDDGVSTILASGISCASIGLRSERGEYVRFTADLIGRGDQAASVLTRPAQQSEDYLYSGDLSFYTGATYAPVTYTASGGTERSTELVSMEFGIECGARHRDVHGQNDGYSYAIDSSDYDVTLETAFEYDDGTWDDMLANETTTCIRVPIVGAQIGVSGQYYTVEVILPMCQVEELEKDEEETTGIVKVTWNVLRDTTNSYPPVVLNVINNVASIGF